MKGWCLEVDLDLVLSGFPEASLDELANAAAEPTLRIMKLINGSEEGH